ncbi:MAG: sigma-70 family RNA polymerase sigma factor [Verrucomicrobiota bacterium]
MVIATEPTRYAETVEAGFGFSWRTPAARSAAPAPALGAPGHARFDATETALEDAVWVERVQKGDEEAARALVQRLYPTVMKSVRCHLSRQGSVEDMTQTVFAKIFAKLHQFSGLVPLEHWVSKITINTCLSQLSREKARPEARMSDLSEEDEVLVQRLLSTEGDLPAEQAVEARELLEKLLAQLRPDERLVVTLLHLEERSTQEISACTGWSISRVKVKAFRARNKMRKAATRLFQRVHPGAYGLGA